MVKQKVKITNATGLHMRPAGELSKKASLFDSHIVFNFEGGEYNAKSVLSILGACVKTDDEIELICDGPDENEALAYLVKMIETRFGE